MRLEDSELGDEWSGRTATLACLPRGHSARGTRPHSVAALASLPLRARKLALGVAAAEIGAGLDWLWLNRRAGRFPDIARDELRAHDRLSLGGGAAVGSAATRP